MELKIAAQGLSHSHHFTSGQRRRENQTNREIKHIRISSGRIELNKRRETLLDHVELAFKSTNCMTKINIPTTMHEDDEIMSSSSICLWRNATNTLSRAEHLHPLVILFGSLNSMRDFILDEMNILSECLTLLILVRRALRLK